LKSSLKNDFATNYTQQTCLIWLGVVALFNSSLLQRLIFKPPEPEACVVKEFSIGSNGFIYIMHIRL